VSTLAIQVRLGLDGSTWQTTRETITWTDVTSSVLFRTGIRITRGRSSQRDEVGAGTCSLTLIDDDRTFDPENASGPYYGYLQPGVPIQIRVSISEASDADRLTWDADVLKWGLDGLTWGASSGSVDRFFGFVEDWPQGHYDPADKRVEIPLEASDAFSMLALGRLKSAYETAVLADGPLGYWPLDETYGTTMRDLSTHGRNGTYVSGTTSQSGSIEVGAITVPGLRLDGEYQGYVNTGVVVNSSSNALGCLIDLSDVDDLTVGQQLAIAEYGEGMTKTFPPVAFQWGVEIVSVTSKTARLYVRGPASWSNFTYSAAFSYATPRFIASRFSAVFTPGTNHYVDGVLANSSSSAANLTGQQWLGFRALGNKSNDKNWQGGIAGLFWNDTGSVDSTRIAAYAAALLEPGDGDTTGERIGSMLDEAGFPTIDRSIATGYTTLGPTNHADQFTLDTIRRVEKSEQGRFFISRSGDATFHARYHGQLVAAASSATFSDDGSDNPYSSVEVNRPRQFIYNKVTVTTDGKQPVTVEDATSIATHGERELTVDAPLLPDQTTQRSLAEYVLANSKDPQARVFGLSVPAHKNLDTIGADILTLEQGDRVTFERTPLSTGSAISWAQIIEGYTERMDTVSWTWTPHLSPAEPITYGVWGTGAWGTTLIWGY
jgi:hypothetical protein